MIRNTLANLSEQKFLIVLLVGIFLISFVSSETFTFDNVKSYDMTLQKVTIKNTFGLGRTIADIKLDTPLIYYVPMGYQKVAQLTINNYDTEYINPFENIDTYNKLDYLISNDKARTLDRKFDYKLLTYEDIIVNDYETKCEDIINENNGTKTNVCTQVIKGNHIEQEERWVNFDTAKLVTGKYTIGIFTDVQKGDKVEWILNAYGVKLSEFAVWEQSLKAGVVVHLSFDDASGYIVTNNATSGGYGYFYNVPNQSVWTTGKYGNGYRSFSIQNYTIVLNVTGSKFGGNYTQCAWYKIISMGNYQFFVEGQWTGNWFWGTNSDGTKFRHYNGAYDDGSGELLSATSVNDNTWRYVCHSRDVTKNNCSIWINGVVDATHTCNADGGAVAGFMRIGSSDAYSFNGVLDEWTLWNRTLTTAEIVMAYESDWNDMGAVVPIVTLNSPVNLTNFTTSTITFNFTIYDNNLGSKIDSMTLYIDSVAVETNTTNMINGTTYIISKAVSSGYHNWSVSATTLNSTTSSSELRMFNVTIFPPTISNPKPEDNLLLNTNALINFNATITDDFGLENVSLYINGGLNETNTSGISGFYDFNKYLGEGSHTWYFRSFDNDSNEISSSTRNIKIDLTLPILSTTNLTNLSTKVFPVSSIWRYNASDLNIQYCYYNTSQNTTYTIVPCNSTINTTWVSEGIKIVQYCANDTTGNSRCLTHPINIVYYSDTQTQSSSTINEGNEVTFTLFVNMTSLPDTNAYLTFNNTNYSTPVKQTFSGYTKFTQVVTIPVGWGSVAGINQSAFWVYNITGFNVEQTPNMYISVYSLVIGSCSVYSHLYYNFSIYDEKTKIVIPNVTGQSTPYLEYDFDFRKHGTTTSFATASGSFNGSDNMVLCSNIQLTGNLKYSVYATIFYTSTNENKSYAKEYYNIQNFTLSNTTAPQHISLYSLDNESSTEFKIYYKDENLIPVENAVIQIQRKYIPTGVFSVVEIPITDANGRTLAHLETSDVIYNFWIYKEGILLATFTNQLAVCDSTILEECQINLNALLSSNNGGLFYTEEDFTFTMSFNETTRTASTYFNIPSGSSALVVLNATINGSLVCSDSITQVTDTLECIIPYSSKNTTAIIYLWKDNVLIGTLVKDLSPRSKDIFNGSQVFLLIIMYLLIFGIAINDNPIITGIIFILGVILAVAVNIIDTGGGSRFIGAGATFLWFVIAIIIVMIRAGRRN